MLNKKRRDAASDAAGTGCKNGAASGKTSRRGNTAKKIAAVLLAVSVLAASAGCGSQGNAGGGSDAAAGENDGWTITLSGLEDGDKTITLGELKQLESVTERAEANRSNGEKVKIKATGPLLGTVLEKLDIDLSKYNTVRFNAKDGYSIALPPDILKNSDIIIAYEDDGKPIEGEDGPVRSVVVGQRAMYWVRMLDSIDFESDAGVKVADKIVLLDTALSIAETETVNIAGADQTCVSTSRLIADYANIDDNTVQNVYMTASDGLAKNEKKDNFLGKYLISTGDTAPEFNAPGLQDGMTVRGLLTVNYGETAFFSVKQGMECMGITETSGHSALPLSAVLRKIGSLSTDVYRFTDAAGNVSEYTADELVDPSIYVENGRAVFTAGTAGSFKVTVNDLLTIEAVE